MNQILSEKEYQHYILDHLCRENGYIRRTNDDFDRLFGIDRELLFSFLGATQPDALEALQKTYGTDMEETVVNFINKRIMQTSLIEVLKSDYLEIGSTQLRLMYSKPATDFNRELYEKYQQNIFSVAEEVWASDRERIDLVVFLNGFAIASFELKCNAAGQSYENAISQYRYERNPKTRLFQFKQGCIVNFAMDLEEVYMTTRLAGARTFFLPFNRGNGEGVQTGKGNPLCKDDYPVSYMWNSILTKDMTLELLNRFVFIDRREEKDTVTGKIRKSENVVFPRFHQLDFIRKALADVDVNHTSQNYLVQHSAGSGKTYSIAWLAHRLASLHDGNNSIIFDNIIIVTDRVIVDRQLQRAVLSIEHRNGLISVMDDKCSSDDLRKALMGNTKIVATTIQKFLYIADITKGLKDKKFAVIIDEAHSSTAGKDMIAVTRTLASGYGDETDMEDIISEEIMLHGKQRNVSMFAFTATPKPTTLRLFGRLNPKGQYEAFHLYSMKQAIEEGFILDVLKNYVPYQTYYKICKKIENDPRYDSKKAKRKIVRFANLHETNINQRIEIIVEHFRNNVMPELDGQAKAMVVTGSRAEAVKYYYAFLSYISRNSIEGIKPIVAFSGKIADSKVGAGVSGEYSESSVNGFPEEQTPDRFDEDYQVLLVANKYQTGFDQPKLCAMYVMKKLFGVNAVQTLSRLNRICPPYGKVTFILDFSNTAEEIEKSFQPYYTTTLLCNSVTPEFIYEQEAKIDGFYLFSEQDVEDANKAFYDREIAPAKREKTITFYLGKARKAFMAYDEDRQLEMYNALRHFVRFYEFLLQVSSFGDNAIHRKYNFIRWLMPYIKVGAPGPGFTLKGQIDAYDFHQKRGEERKAISMTVNPVVKLPEGEPIKLSDEEEKTLSEIIAEVNSRTGKSFDNDVAIKAALQIKDLMLKNKDLRASAQHNSVKDFQYKYFDNIDNALVDGRAQNQEFYDLLLSNETIRNEIMGVFVNETYRHLRTEGLNP